MKEQVRKTGRGSHQMDQQQLEQFLSTVRYGTFSYENEEGWPDSRVLNVGYYNGNLYCHVAKKVGAKLKSWENGKKVCVSLYQEAVGIGEQFICTHDSALVYGKLIRIDNQPELFDEMVEGVKQLCMQSEMPHKAEMAFLDKCIHAIGVWKVVPEYKVGKKVSFSTTPEEHKGDEE